MFVAGGIGSGLLMVHYLMMGAAGVQFGTKFAVADESIAHENFKNVLLKAASKDAVPTAQFDPRVPVIPVRAIVNEGTRDFVTLQLGLIAQIERGEMTPREAQTKLEEFWIGGLRKAVIDGDVEGGSIMAGQSVGLINEAMPVRDLIRITVDECVQEIERFTRILTGRDM